MFPVTGAGIELHPRAHFLVPFFQAFFLLLEIRPSLRPQKQAVNRSLKKPVHWLGAIGFALHSFQGLNRHNCDRLEWESVYLGRSSFVS